MFFLTQILLVFSQNITWTKYSFAFPQFIPLIADKTVFSRTFEEFGQILNVSIEYLGDQIEPICNFQYQSIVFYRLPDTLISLVSDMQQYDIDLLKTEEIQQGFSAEFISYAINNRNIIILEKDGTIHHLYYNIGPKFTNYTKHQLSIIYDGNENQQIIADGDFYYYVDHKQLFKFTILNGNLEQFQFFNWQQVDGHFKIFVRKDYLYLINGNYGMTIYKEENNVLIQVNKFTIKDFQQSLSNLNLVDYAVEDDQLYLLDQENGVYRFNITSMHIDRQFFIDQKGCRTISIKNNQIILVQQAQLFSEIYEGMIVEHGWIMIRKRTSTKQVIKNIYQFNTYALLISNPINNMYQKNLIDSFTNPSISKGKNYYQFDLLGISEMEEDYVVGVFKYGVGIYFSREKPAQISCQAKLSQQNRVIIRLNSTNCLNKNQSDILNYCQNRLDYVFDVHGVLMSSNEENIYIYMCIVAFSIVVGLFLAIFFVIRKYQLKKEKIDHIRKSRRSLSY